ncbi:MXAN_5187 C-terminal domain-containing protein [Sorangium sp. So ce861]|uniref:MXAN_5187 C-terminal domain-containing protein n=1 Tax=Sorangium sp. So ce861 TaxID=3133323 RepID=UPI003F637DBA
MESSEVERELEELETRIERLRALYEQYFMGIERIEPLIPRKEVERRIWVMRREQIRNTGLRFKFQMLIQRYNTFQQYWGRIAREIENGTYRRDVIRAAKRVGTKEALTIVGRKRAERYAELAEQQAAREAARRDDADDHDEIDVDDEAVTLAPPPLPAASPSRKQPPVELDAEEASPRESVAPPVAPPPAAAPAGPQVRPALVPPATPQAAAAVKPAPLGGLPRGLGLTRPQQKPPEIKPAEAKAAEAKPTEAAPAGARAPARPAADRAPAAGAASRQRLAELAAEMRAQRAQSAKTGDAAAVAGGSPGALTDVAPEPPPAAPKRPPPPLPVRSPPGAAAAPAAAAPPAASAPGAAKAPAAAAAAPPAGSAPGAAKAPAAAAPAATAAAAGEARGAGARRQDRVHSERPPPSRRRRSTAPPAADTGTVSGGARQAAPRASSRPPEAARAGLDAATRPRPGPPPQRSAARDDELPEQRLRQIYAKYVETKRAARESTAGVTYERLAESLRAQAAKLRATNPAKSVDYDVVVKDGKTLLKPILK